MMRRFALRAMGTLVLSVVAVSCADQPTDPAQPNLHTSSIAPVYGVGASQSIPDQYIVVLRKDVENTKVLARQLARAHGGTVQFDYEHALKGFSVNLPAAAVSALSRHPNIAYIEQDRIVTVASTQITPPSWGLDRVDQRSQPNDGLYNYTATGTGVHVYIADSGIRSSHSDFGGRVSFGFDVYGEWGEDCSGHGTHVAGTVGGATYGIAKEVQLVSVRVLDCYGGGTISGIVAGIDWITYNHVKPAVANLSLGTRDSPALDEAVANSIAAGVIYAIAAGNSDTDACTFSPARVPDALTVGSTNSSDVRSLWSNWGSCLDLFAPGEAIVSASHYTDTEFQTKSGTSMAAPHVAGAAALFLQSAPNALPAEVSAAITGTATTAMLSDIGVNSPNRLLFSLLSAEEIVVLPPPPAPPPVTTVEVTPASATVTVGETVQLTATMRDANGNVLTGHAVSWSTSNANVATVSASGNVTAATGGSAIITATSEGKSGTATITVPAVPVATVEVSPPGATLTVGETVQLVATTRDANGNVLSGRTVSWSTSDANVVSVSSTGLITAVNGGSAVITATSEGMSGTASITVTPPPPPPEPVAPCEDCTLYQGMLEGGGATEQLYNSSEPSTHQGWLQGPSDANFDLYLYKWRSGRWVLVAQTQGATSIEELTYFSSPGTYKWVVYAASGSGSYKLWLKTTRNK